MVKIIFSDIDGTLINDALKVTPRTRQALRHAVDAGILFVPVSARMPEAIKPILTDFLPDVPMISYNGAFIQDENGQVIDSCPMSPQAAQAICQYLEKEVSEVAWNVYSGEKWLSQNRMNKWISREEEVVGLVSQEADLETIGHLSEVHKLLLMGEPEKMVTLEEKLKELYPGLSIARSLPYYIEVMANGIQKGRAVSLLADHYGVDTSETLAFGDNFNDLDMLEVAGEAYVMANAPQEVKERVGHVTASHNHDGIALVLEKLGISSFE
ncbi:Cof-type HAD-IIB family hydrolase [Streptococcus macedonicus]|uniref:Cof-type HAD-IIB family hydrolase n=1 Tax=Streptococcus macedonicus TaxID=59310 RepID=A0AA47IL54_STRMC|nr:Cof-type HAD-IIB family hydrolase [Streptococcus macedonicus]CCF01412.1 Hydrolase, haloacid dehalogenase-like family [Streptococcus macedonicus ACA-DC 198]MCW8485659.1 Cof-type HAD-IIB family hydrolase [Streptococcus macedonicus]MCW8493882.1 Cof-type HAD-IIB family hydrolase [Streptococcus macedonicus]MCW8499173.1 Cof-type HAD-IIB family hydrolase [Streptococcus macedonicus]MCW8501242.1 Cof-type HAD-IIB family hydrolase [Streptococcus macedonicus]